MTVSAQASVDRAWLHFQDRFIAETPRSRELTERAKAVLPGGSTRTVGWFAPYPMAFERGSGPYLFDADGRQYIDLFCNGLSLIHGHAYPPVVDVAERILRSGTAWPGTSESQIAFAELLSDRIPSHGLVRFANTGTEASMLAVKLARAFTGRQSILKTWAGYHGSYDVLEAGLHGKGEDPGRARLGDFNDLRTFERAFAQHGTEIAAVVLESVMYTGIVTAAEREFLVGAQELAHRHGALFILDDCLMFRLAEGGSAEYFDIEADLTMLGKFIGGGTPVGAVVGRPDIVCQLDPHRADRVYHGGSFNGNVLGTACGTVAVRDLTGSVIADMDRRATRLRTALETAAAERGLPLVTTGIGSAFGAYLSEGVPSPTGPRDDVPMSRLFHLAVIRRGVLIGDGNEFALSSVVDDDVTTEAIDRLTAALDDVANELDAQN